MKFPFRYFSFHWIKVWVAKINPCYESQSLSSVYVRPLDSAWLGCTGLCREHCLLLENILAALEGQLVEYCNPLLHSFTHTLPQKKDFGDTGRLGAVSMGACSEFHWCTLKTTRKYTLEKMVPQKRLWGHSIAWCSVLAPNSTITRCYIALMHFKKQLKKIRLKSVVSQRRHLIAWCSVLAPTTPGAVWLSLSLPFIKLIIILSLCY